MNKNCLKFLSLSFICLLFLSLYQTQAYPYQLEKIVLKESFVRPDVILAGERVELKFILKNEFGVDVGLIGRLIVDGKEVSGNEISIESGKEGALILNYNFSKKGLYKVSVLIDLIDEKEKGVQNKIWDDEVIVKEREIVGIELKIVGGISFYPPFPKPDEDVELTIEIKNVGSKEANDVVVMFYADGSYLEREIVDIDAGESITVMVVWQADKGEKLIRVVVDPKGEFGDYRYDNNKERWITVR